MALEPLKLSMRGFHPHTVPFGGFILEFRIFFHFLCAFFGITFAGMTVDPDPEVVSIRDNNQRVQYELGCITDTVLKPVHPGASFWGFRKSDPRMKHITDSDHAELTRKFVVLLGNS